MVSCCISVIFCCISECPSLIYIFCRLPYVEQPRTITQVFLPPLHMNSRHCYYDCPTPLYNGSSHSNYVRSAAVIMSTTNTYTTRHRTLIQTCLIYLYMYLCHNSLYFISQHVSLPLSYKHWTPPNPNCYCPKRTFAHCLEVVVKPFLIWQHNSTRWG